MLKKKEKKFSEKKLFTLFLQGCKSRGEITRQLFIH